MKRAVSTGSNDSGDGQKKSRGDSQDYGGSFEEELMMMEEMEQLADAEAQMMDEDESPDDTSCDMVNTRRWKRPEHIVDPKTESLSFQWLDIDQTNGEPWRTPQGEIFGSTEGPVPVIRLYGVTSEKTSVMLSVHGFTSYMYVSLPPSLALSEQCLAAIRATLDVKIRERARGEEKRLVKCILGTERVVAKQSLLGYHSDTTRDFLKVYVAMPSLLPQTKRAFDEGFAVAGFGVVSGQCYEANVPYILRFMIDKDINGADWVECPAGAYTVRQVDSPGRSSRCTLEADIDFDHLLTHACTGIWQKIAPLRVLSFDIECMGRKGHFPEAQHDPVIQIASTVTLQGSSQPMLRTVFTLDSCLPIVGAQVISSATEGEMLMNWQRFMLDADADILTGYNIANFDLPYLLNRAKTLEKTDPKLKRFAELGRLKNVKAVMKDTTFQSSAYGKRENIETTIHGRVIFDVMPYMFRNHKLSSYSLNSVSAEFLGQQKEDVHHSIISDLQKGSDADRHRLAVYCLKDAHLPQQLMVKLSILVNYIEMARVTGVPLNYLLTRGQQIKVFSMLLRKCKRTDLLIPTMSKTGGNDETYEGATVIEPKKAYYETPISTLDFASLYPSIMQAYNLCYSTLLSTEDKAKMSEADYEKSPTGHFFVRSSKKKGILPQILDELLTARKRAKKDMAAATDPEEKAVQNGRQLALKISANSVYGFTGATVGQLPCLAIAASTTSYGRVLLFETRNYVESTYTIANGYKYNAEVVYGDTDSVMVKFGPPTIAETMPLAEKAAEEVSKIFPRPIRLEFEKIYYPYLLMNKKRYAGLLWTQPEKYDYMDCKGLETVRRDNCLLVRRLVDTCLRKILIERNVQGAIDYAKGTISDLLQNKLDISMLVISKSLGKSADDADYSSKQAHVELAMRMKKRDPGTAPNVGDRVAYVIIQAGKNAPAYEKSEDPVYVLENNLPIDTEYYLSNQLSNPLTRIFEPIISNPKTLLSGDHTRVVSKPTPTAKAGGIMMFAVKTLKCMGCKTPIPKSPGNTGHTPLCKNCSGREEEIYMNKLVEVNNHEQVFSKLWTECQHCQGSFHQEVLCSNRDCPIFYKRKKVQIDLQAAQDSLDRFNW